MRCASLLMGAGSRQRLSPAIQGVSPWMRLSSMLSHRMTYGHGPSSRPSTVLHAAAQTRGSSTTPLLKMWFAFSLRRIGGKSSSGGDMHAVGQMTCGVSSACRWRQQDPHRCTHSTARPVRMMLDVARGKHELSMKSKHFLRIQQILKCGVDSRLNDLFHPGLSSVYQLI